MPTPTTSRPVPSQPGGALTYETPRDAAAGTDRLRELLRSASEVLAELLAAVDDCGRRHDVWRARLRAEQVPADGVGRAEDAGGGLAFDGRRVAHPELRPDRRLADDCAPRIAALGTDPAGFERARLGASDAR
ncbi:hypothetical protein [Frankia gtarii]|uniref:hypothetical protein n=1 Tax=Frankia gtarii TaxID=2950102 RepID=UPI0021C1AC2F|nr:hypothetical protein [Frankia gtarii]